MVPMDHLDHRVSTPKKEAKDQPVHLAMQAMLVPMENKDHRVQLVPTDKKVALDLVLIARRQELLLDIEIIYSLFQDKTLYIIYAIMLPCISTIKPLIASIFSLLTLVCSKSGNN